MSLEDNKTVVRRFLEESLIQGNMGVYDTSFAPHVAIHYYGTPTHSHASYRVLIQQFRQAFSGHALSIDDLIAEGDKVAVHVSYAVAAHHAQFGKNPPTGQPFQMEAMAVFRFEQGKVVELWALFQGIDLDVSP